MGVETLRETLSDWTDIDVACYQIGLLIGLFNPEPAHFKEVQGLFFPAYFNKNGNQLVSILDSLVSLGALECRDHDWQCRWSPDFDGLKHDNDGQSV